MAESPLTRDKACACEICPAAMYGVRINFELPLPLPTMCPKAVAVISNNEAVIVNWLNDEDIILCETEYGDWQSKTIFASNHAFVICVLPLFMKLDRFANANGRKLVLKYSFLVK